MTSAVRISLGVVAGLTTISCGNESDYERKLSRSIAEQAEVIDSLMKSTDELTAALKTRENSVIRQSLQTVGFSRPPVAINDRTEYLFLSTHCQVKASSLTSSPEAVTDEPLMKALQADPDVEFSPLSSVRISAGKDNYGETASQENRAVRMIPSPDRRRRNTQRTSESTGPLGDRLDPLFRPRSIQHHPVGTIDVIQAGRTTDADGVQIVLNHGVYLPPVSHKASLPVEGSPDDTDRFATLTLRSPSSRSEKLSVRLSLNQWRAISTNPAIDDPEYVSILFVNIIELK